MRARTFLSSILIASMGIGSLSYAQPRQDAREARQDIRDAQRDLRRADNPREAREARRDLREAQRDLREARQDHRDDRRDARRDFRRDERHYYNARGPEFRRGGHLPYELRQRAYVVNNWRAYHLAPPPRGHQWVQVGPDFVLTVIATGLIVNLVLN